MPLERDLQQLLFTHDCVIVPRFGGFLTHYRSARLDEQRRSIHPPSKDLSFNRHLVRSDGLLADHVAREEGLSFNQANAVIDGEVDAWRSKLDRDGRLELPRIGTFYRDAEKNLQFDPDRRVNFLKDAFGLRPVPAIALPRVEPKPVPKIIPLPPLVRKEEPVVVKETVQERAFPWTWAAATVATLLVTAATWYAVTTTHNNPAQWSGFDLFGSHEPAHFAPRPAGTPIADGVLDTAHWDLPSERTGIAMLAVPGTDMEVTVDLGPEAPKDTLAISTVAVHVAHADSTHVAVAAPPRMRFHIIGGCFLMHENAEAFVAGLQARGFAASIIDRKGGLYRVAYGSYPDRSLALDALAAVRKEEAPEAWLLVR